MTFLMIFIKYCLMFYFGVQLVSLYSFCKHIQCVLYNTPTHSLTNSFSSPKHFWRSSQTPRSHGRPWMRLSHGTRTSCGWSPASKSCMTCSWTWPCWWRLRWGRGGSTGDGDDDNDKYNGGHDDNGGGDHSGRDDDDCGDDEACICHPYSIPVWLSEFLYVMFVLHYAHSYARQQHNSQ